MKGPTHQEMAWGQDFDAIIGMAADGKERPAVKTSGGSRIYKRGGMKEWMLVVFATTHLSHLCNHHKMGGGQK